VAGVDLFILAGGILAAWAARRLRQRAQAAPAAPGLAAAEAVHA
jgi:hypothetical protein